MHPSIIFRNPPWPSVCHATPAASLLLETGQSDWLLKSVWWGEGCAYHISKCLSEGVVLSCSRRPVVRRRGSRGEEHWPVSLPVASCKTPPQALGGGVEGHKGQDGLRSVVMKQCLGYWRYSYGTCYTCVLVPHFSPVMSVSFLVIYQSISLLLLLNQCKCLWRHWHVMHVISCHKDCNCYTL